MAKLVKLTSKNQLTLPVEIMRDYPGVDYFEVRETDAGILLEPVKTVKLKAGGAAAQLAELQAHVKRLGLSENDVKDAVRWAREQKP